MALAPGSRLGPYEIVATLGAGGMGEVYRARDTRLGREVALKVLPADVSEDSQRRLRFEQEARAASALNHPNIVSVYDVGHEGGVSFIVTELIEGESLRAVLARGPIRTRRVLEMAVQIADGLAVAHAANIVHRDLKPENIMLTRDQRVKILDFGLAKNVAPAAPGDETATLARTQPGMVMGTAGYMSPEQVRGVAADQRSDIFSFGAILYELLSGRRAFSGETSIEIMNGILKEDPPELPARLPAGIEPVVRHCLEKDPRRRFQSAQDLAFGLQALLGTSTSGAAPAVAEKSPRRRTMPVVGAAAVLVLGVLAGVLGGRALWRSEPPAFHQLTYRRGTVSNARFAPDGRTVIYSAAWEGVPHDVYSARAEFPESRPLGVSGGSLLAVSAAGEMAVALDTRSLMFSHFYGTLARVPISGGAPRALLSDVYEADWAPKSENLGVVHMVGGIERLEYPIGKALYQTAGWISCMRFSPRGDRIAFLDHPARGDNRGSVAMVDLAGKKTTLAGGWASEQGLAWAPGGDEIWFTASGSGLPKGIRAVTPGGKQRDIARMPAGVRLCDVAPDGRVLLATENVRAEMMGLSASDKRERNLAWLDASLPRDLSQDGKLVLFFEQGEATGANYATYIRRTDGSPAVRLGEGSASSLSPNGKWALVVIPSSPSQLVLLPTAEGMPKRLPQAGINYQQVGTCWFADSRRFLFGGNEAGHGARLWMEDIDGSQPRPVTPEGVSVLGNAIAPDGKSVVATGPDELLALYPLDGGKPRPLPGVKPGEAIIRWSADGRQVYVYARATLPANVYRVDVETGKRELLNSFAPSDPTGVFRMGRILLTADGKMTVYGFTRLLSDLYLVDGLK